MKSILITEDNPGIFAFVDKGLRAAGYATALAEDGSSALTQARTGNFSLVILDIGLPVIDGFEVLRTLRKEGNGVPVVVLTAYAGADNAAHGFAAGATDYMTKPFRFAELLTRVRHHLNDAAEPAGNHTLEHHGLRIDTRTLRAFSGNRTIELDRRDFSLLEFFMQHPGEVLTSQQLLDQVWGGAPDQPGVVDDHVHSLLEKLDTLQVEAIPGAGYRLR